MQNVDEIYQEFAEKNHFPGYAFGVMVDGHLVQTGSGGFIDLAKKNPATPQSMFRIASMTKSFTAMAIVKLRDENKLSLDDQVYESKLTGDAPHITIRDLMIHTAGFPTDDPWGDRQLNQTEAEFAALINKGLNFSTVPGTTFEYSNLGYAMLGSIISKVSGMPYEQYILKMIQQIGMKEVTWDYTKVSPSTLAHGYRWINEEWQEEPLLGPGVFGAMGGLITSIESFAPYIALHQSAWPPRDGAETGPVKRSSLREMQRPWIFSDVDKERGMTNLYGYGLRWSRDDKGRVYIGHSGGLPGFGSNWMIMPEYGIGVVLLANVTYAQASKVNLDVLDKIIKPKGMPLSDILKERQGALVKLLPNWENANDCGIFAVNFFLDYPTLKEQIAKAGTIISIGDIIPENRLAGHFILHGDKKDLQISIGLTPENPPLIQKFQVKEL